MKGHRLHVRRKMKEIMEIKENRGLIDKKAYEDLWAGLVNIIFFPV